MREESTDNGGRREREGELERMMRTKVLHKQQRAHVSLFVHVRRSMFVVW